MASTKGFIREVKDAYGMRPVIPFQTPINIGDVGFLGADDIWNPVSTTRQRFGFERTPNEVSRRLFWVMLFCSLFSISNVGM